MNISVVMAHPAHVHFFKNFIFEMEERGDQISVLVKERENTTELLDLIGIDYETFGRTYQGRPGKAVGVLLNDLSLLKKMKRSKPDMTMSIGGLYSVHAGKLLGVPAIDFMDTEGARYTNMLTFPFADVIATPDCYREKVPEKKHISYPGYHELAYLHPDRFELDDDILDELGLQAKEYTLVRFSSMDASHQVGERALSVEEKVKLVEELERYGPVLVDTEGPLPKEIEDHALNIPPHRYHHLLANAKLYLGEGATAASESGVLGVPWVFISNHSRCYLDDQERNYGLGRTVRSYSGAMTFAEKVWKEDTERFQKARKELLKDKIDVTNWMIELAEGYK